MVCCRKDALAGDRFRGALPLAAETREGTLVIHPLLAAREQVFGTVLERHEVAWPDQRTPGQCGVGRPLVAEVDVQRWLDGKALVDGRAMPATSGAAAEPLRASPGQPVAQESGSPPNWKLLIDALEWYDSVPDTIPSSTTFAQRQHGSAHR
jgi:hypothetical protein